MHKREIISLRECNPFFYNTVMFEWEDDLVKEGWELRKRSRLLKFFYILLQKGFHIKYRIRQQRQNRLAFLMFVPQYREYYPEDIIPIFIDTRDDTFPLLLDSIKDCRGAIITNRSAYEVAKKVYPDKKIYSLPLWVSSKWAVNDIPLKTIDVLQLGRKNEILHQYMLRYTECHPHVEYVYIADNAGRDYYSTTRGNIGPLESRNDFMNILRESKISLVSSPLVDTNYQLDFITPRVYESAISYCYMIGRFTKNEEFNEIGLDKVCDLVDDYETFEKLVDHYLSYSSFLKKKIYDEFLSRNSSEVRIDELERLFQKIQL